MITKGIEKLAKNVSGQGFSPRSISQSTAQAAAASSPGPAYLGYDTFACPTNTVLQRWFSGTGPDNPPPPFVFIGFYLAPTNSQNRLNPSYMTRRADIASIGYGFGIFYLGWRAEELTSLTIAQCTQRGQDDGLDAVRLAGAGGGGKNGAGFTRGVIYFDRENNKPPADPAPTANELAYIQAWIDYVTNNGYFTPGLYCSRGSADALHNGLTGISRWWISGTLHGPGCSVNIGTLTPPDCGMSFATDWQYALACNKTFNGSALSVDLDMSFSQNPSDT